MNMCNDMNVVTCATDKNTAGVGINLQISPTEVTVAIGIRRRQRQ